jgi:hypothetical protein
MGGARMRQVLEIPRGERVHDGDREKRGADEFERADRWCHAA